MFNRSYSRLITVLLAVIFMAVLLLNTKQTGADLIQDRSIVLSSTIASEVVSNTYHITPPSTSSIGSIVFEYCSNSPVLNFTCTAPAGLDVGSANLSGQSGNTGFSVDNTDTTANKLVITRPAAAGIVTPSTYIFNNVTNPSTAGQIVFVRITIHASTDGSGPYSDAGAVAFNVSAVFNIGAYVPPFLQLCVGITVAPDCTSQAGDFVDLGDLSINVARSGQSQFSTATNDPSGYVIYAIGTTLTSGNNIIPAPGSPAPSFPGTGQFGINLRSNLIPSTGQDPVGVGTGQPTPNYNIPNRYLFNSGDSITTASLPSNYNRMTVSYIANIPSKQAPGIYSTTFTYVATVQF